MQCLMMKRKLGVGMAFPYCLDALIVIVQRDGEHDALILSVGGVGIDTSRGVVDMSMILATSKM